MGVKENLPENGEVQETAAAQSSAAEARPVNSISTSRLR